MTRVILGTVWSQSLSDRYHIDIYRVFMVDLNEGGFI